MIAVVDVHLLTLEDEGAEAVLVYAVSFTMDAY